MANKSLTFEIGTEELPAFDLHKATLQLEKLFPETLDAAGIPHGEVKIYTTPRRLAMQAFDVPEQTEARCEEYRGPSVRIAFDEAGNPTKAAEGFARGKGITVSDLERREEGGTEYVYAVKEIPAKDVAELLPGLLRGLIDAITWPKTQRWGAFSESFSRPVRWLLAMHGQRVIPFEYAGLKAGNTTRGHRFLAPGPHELECGMNLTETLRAAYVIPTEAERETSIRDQVAAIEAETGLRAELDARTMQEVVNLCEYPTVMIAEFDPLFLAVPKEITVDAMLVHQRYFPLFNSDGSLSNKFLVTSNGDPQYRDNIIDGNQRVVAARLYDAKFFYDEDLKLPLEAYVDRLDQVVFQESLGTTRAKVDRMVALAGALAEDAGLSEEDAAEAKRAAYLAKADLVTGAVVEFTSVQGIMGRYYALAAGETPQVAQAIADHYRPRFAGDDLPESEVGRIVAMADKLDTICGMFAIGQGPTGSSDPFALRRSAIGIVNILDAGLDVSLLPAIDKALDGFENDGISFDRDSVRETIVEFFVTRTKVMARDEGADQDSVDAVMAVDVEEPAEILRRVRALEAARKESPEIFSDLAIAYARANNLRDPEAGPAPDESLFTERDHALASAVTQAESKLAKALADNDYPQALAELAELRAPIDEFFDKVMVMDEDLAIRENRMKLLNAFVAVFANVADFGCMAK